MAIKKKVSLADIKFGDLNPGMLTAEDTMDQRSFGGSLTKTTTAMRQSASDLLTPDITDGKILYDGMVLRSTKQRRPFITSAVQNLVGAYEIIVEGDGVDDYAYYTYKVAVYDKDGCMKPPETLSEAKGLHQGVINMHPTAYPVDGANFGALPAGLPVTIMYEHLGVGSVPKIVRIGNRQVPLKGAKIDHTWNAPHLPRTALGAPQRSAFTGPTPVADKLREELDRLGPNFYEKGNQLSDGGDMKETMLRAAISVLRTIKTELPMAKIKLSAGNDNWHQVTPEAANSRHRRGRAVDFTIEPHGAANLDKIVEILRRHAGANGGHFRFIDEYRKPTGHSTGGHFHMSWGQGKEAVPTMREAEKMVSDGTIQGITVA